MAREAVRSAPGAGRRPRGTSGTRLEVAERVHIEPHAPRRACRPRGAARDAARHSAGGGGGGQPAVKWWSKSGQPVVGRRSNSGQTVVQQWSNSGRTAVSLWRQRPRGAGACRSRPGGPPARSASRAGGWPAPAQALAGSPDFTLVPSGPARGGAVAREPPTARARSATTRCAWSVQGSIQAVPRRPRPSLRPRRPRPRSALAQGQKAQAPGDPQGAAGCRHLQIGLRTLET